MSEVNVPLLRKVVEWAEAEHAKGYIETKRKYSEFVETEPGEFGWVSRVESIFQPVGQWYQELWVSRFPTCGTAYCIAGYIGQMVDPKLAEAAKEKGDFWYLEGPRMVEAPVVAREALGITPDQSRLLFAPENTIEDVRRIAEEIAGEPL